jgi:CubicO group peptidase (beta-lactamase class C family)
MTCCFGCNSFNKTTVAHYNEEISSADIALSQTELIANVLSEFPNNSEVAIAIIKSNRVNYYGLKRTNDSLHIVDNSNLVFEIGSITKVFTTQLLIDLFEEGKIESIDEPIHPYIDFTIKSSPTITFKQLANHTSGLPGNIDGNIFNTDRSNPYKKWDKAKFVNFLVKDVKLNATPGEKYEYSNVGMALLASIISTIESKDYEILLQEKILQPLEMERSTTQRHLVQNYLVQGYNWKGKPTTNWDLAEMRGAGAMLSTVHDMSKYLIWNFDALDNQLALMKQSTKSINENLEIALGWHLIKNETEMPFLWHNGGTGGYKSSMAINLTNDTGVIIFSNIGATNNPKKGLIDRLCFNLMKTLEV